MPGRIAGSQSGASSGKKKLSRCVGLLLLISPSKLTFTRAGLLAAVNFRPFSLHPSPAVSSISGVSLTPLPSRTFLFILSFVCNIEQPFLLPSIFHESSWCWRINLACSAFTELLPWSYRPGRFFPDVLAHYQVHSSMDLKCEGNG